MSRAIHIDTAASAQQDVLRIWLAPEDLIVVAGLPGAGKSTLLRTIDNRSHAIVLDSDQVRDWFTALLPGWVQYRWYRPMVHLIHRVRIALCAATSAKPVVAHEPATRTSTRTLLATIGMLANRNRHLLWISATAEEARQGQQQRNRVINPRSFARHVRRARSVERRLRERRRLRGWHSTQLVRRPAPRSALVLLPAFNDIGLAADV